MYKIVQAIGNTIGGGVRGDLFKELYQLDGLIELPPKKLNKKEPANGWINRNIFQRLLIKYSRKKLKNNLLYYKYNKCHTKYA